MTLVSQEIFGVYNIAINLNRIDRMYLRKIHTELQNVCIELNLV